MAIRQFSSESVTEGHPDKVCDAVSDAILDACIAEDPESRVAVETLVTRNFCCVAGEITTKAKVDYEKVIRQKIRDIGYTDPSLGFSDKCELLMLLHEQSPDIAVGVSGKREGNKEQGAGDQGMMFGYACNETPQLMPLPIMLAHALTNKLTEVRKNGSIPEALPDGKSQVTVEYDGRVPKRVSAVVVSVHHKECDIERLREQISNKVIKPVLGSWLNKDTKVFINATGKFALGGPAADTGVTGRKIIVDTYGGRGRHGGGAFSGKDPSKVDRSAAYIARYIAKNVVAAGLADECEIQISYCIGYPDPLGVHVECFGTNKIPQEEIEELIKRNFNLKPAEIIKTLDLKRPIYSSTVAYGHFGKEGLPWERTDKAKILREQARNISEEQVSAKER
ncbi:MAG: methionine adenosyltransferase [Candidatus Marsarchaeota archaeon]|jgi:S-adenosylmethionine synthetase|nr:methionine adenosyltransferase [Candidatus Marsarchaeota archaeon]MCL5115326.1 methionine adenosyltransferase [Candidatus Marsarchaeota archaeon]